MDAEQHMSPGCVCSAYSMLCKGKECAKVAALGQGETVYKRTDAFQERQSQRDEDPFQRNKWPEKGWK